jgi:cyclopropane fatty-acyl-phospholipid synthase-like methyltransferase
MKKNSDWWYEFFTSFRPVFDQIPVKTTNAQVRYIIKKLGLKSGKTFLDCPCGIGRIALPLVRKGIKVTGVDFYKPYLDELDKKAKKRGLKIGLVNRDMRRIDFKNRFDAAGNIWTSLGYFDKEADNLLVLKKMHMALKKRGKFILAIINRDYIVSDFRQRGWFKAGDHTIFEDSEFDFSTSTTKSTWYFQKGEKTETHTMRIRVYSYHEIKTMLEKVGFTDVQGFGSFKDEPITKDNHVMWLIGSKAG